jgi:hypothetical protein
MGVRPSTTYLAQKQNRGAVVKNPPYISEDQSTGARWKNAWGTVLLDSSTFLIADSTRGYEHELISWKLAGVERGRVFSEVTWKLTFSLTPSMIASINFLSL